MYEFDISRFRSEYYDWMTAQIGGDSYCGLYSKLLHYLDGRPFYWKIPLDDNRAGDALDMRQDYADSGLYSGGFVDNSGEMGSPSVLEVLVALAMRIDHDIMWDEKKGDQSYKWFWIMIRNLGIDFDDSMFNKNKAYISRQVTHWLERAGDVWLFPLKGYSVKEMQKMDIWMQMNHYV